MEHKKFESIIEVKKGAAGILQSFDFMLDFSRKISSEKLAWNLPEVLHL